MTIGESGDIGVADHGIGVEPLAIGQKHTAGATVLDADLADLGVIAELHAKISSESGERLGQALDAAVDDPDTRQLYMRDDTEGWWRGERRGADVGGVAAEQLS